MDTETAYDDDSEPTEDPEEESSVPTGVPDTILPFFDETLRVGDVVGYSVRLDSARRTGTRAVCRHVRGRFRLRR